LMASKLRFFLTVLGVLVLDVFQWMAS
jgi:hypothetical protein